MPDEDSAKPVRVMLVEDHAAFRQDFAFMLNLQPEFEAVAQAGSPGPVGPRKGSTRPSWTSSGPTWFCISAIARGWRSAQTTGDQRAADRHKRDHGSENEKGLSRLYSLGYEFPSEYRRFLQGAAGQQKLTVPPTKDRFPYLLHSKTIQVNRVGLLVKLSSEFASADGNGTTFKLTCPDAATTIGFDLSAASKLGDLLRVAKDLPQDQQVQSDPDKATWTLEVTSVASDLEDSRRLVPNASRTSA